MKLQIKVDDKTGKIVDARFKTFGCGSAIASSSAAILVKNSLKDEGKANGGSSVQKKNTEIAKHLSLPPVKLHCNMLVEDAIKVAVKDCEAKRAKETASGEAATEEKLATA
ncbi:unnamed protein product [Sphenostylis stenocarpa]|uniref:NIF system FeS cluster assembly NifU N-terminal domain-containing protein n=1 Tax=Sphenostylis stenocarpa TaxID=92480 RepID=A0AA86S6Q1_9FABA|nr:unnamed protein product [Sphenostylis stenocarpa]